jgi:Putative beta-lactamase-inhibitor-like, PepSY-like
MKIRHVLALLVAVAFLFSVSCKEKEDEAGGKAEVKAKTAGVEKAERSEAVEKAGKGEKKEVGEREEKEEKEEGEENEKAEAGEKAEAAKPAVDLNVLPAAVLSAFKAAYPNAVIRGASKEVENGVTQFEVESMDGTLARDLLYAPDGKVIELEEAIAAADLPAAVKATLAKEYPGYEVAKAETLTKGAVKQYELTLKPKMLGVTIDPNGKIVEKAPEKPEKN